MQGEPFGEAGIDVLARVLVLPGNSLLSHVKLAKLLGIHRCTVARYRKVAQARADSWQRAPVNAEDLHKIERQLVCEAQSGNVQAARILFERLKAIAPQTLDDERLPLPTVDELEDALAMLRQGGI